MHSENIYSSLDLRIYIFNIAILWCCQLPVYCVMVVMICNGCNAFLCSCACLLLIVYDFFTLVHRLMLVTIYRLHLGLVIMKQGILRVAEVIEAIAWF